MKQKVILYGIGLEGEKFYWKYRNKVDIIYCIDKNCGRDFHGIRVYSIDDVKNEIKDNLVIVAVVGGAYKAVEKNLINIGLQEFDNYISTYLLERKLAIFYGNCHMEALAEYLIKNPWFNKEYAIRQYAVCASDKKFPSELELRHCKLLIGMDIREDNNLGVPSINDLAEKTSKNCRCIKFPNLFGYNLFFPQCVEGREYIKKHLNKNAIDLDVYLKEKGKVIASDVGRLGYRDINIERMYQEKKTYEEIIFCIQSGEIYSPEEIKRNFEEQMQRIIEREKLCDIQISDYIEQNYRKVLLFYEPRHPTETLIFEKARRILKLLNIPIDETVPVMQRLDFQEIFIYGCVKKALNMQFEQNYIRRGYTNATLSNRPVDLKEYVTDYIAWVCEEE